MKAKIEQAIAYLKSQGVDYADLRLVDTLTERIQTEYLGVKDISNTRSKGVGIRVIYDGSLGFSSSNDLADLNALADRAIAIAKASRKTQQKPIEMSKRAVVMADYQTPIEIDPFKVKLADKVEYLLACEKAMVASADIQKSSGHMLFQRQSKVFADTAGSYITQTLYESGAGLVAVASADGDTQRRSYPQSAGGNFGTAGYEFIEEMKLLENAPQLAKEAYDLVRAEVCPSGFYDLIIDTDQMHLQIHESVGHPLELDRIYGSELSFAGGSFVTPERIREGFKYGSEHVTITSDAISAGALGTYGFDDDGVRAGKIVLIDKGVLKSAISGRDSAALFGTTSSGANRADGWQNIPIVRMNNISLAPGSDSLQSLIGGVKDGLFLRCNKSWSIDDMRVNFQFGVELAEEIKDGKLTGKIYKNAVYSGITPEFWGSCDGVASAEHYKVFGIPNCGKGQPGQTAHVAHGSAPARFRQVKVGV